MEKYVSSNELADFLERRMHAVKLAAGLLLKELSTSTRDSVILSRRSAESIFATIDIFIEDAEEILQAVGRGRGGGAYREVGRPRERARRVEAPARPLRSVKPLK